MRNIATLIAVAVASALLVDWIRHYALARDILDRPTHRSSHKLPVPRGGGLGVIVATVLGYLAIQTQTPPWALGLALSAVVPTALVGWLDDRRGLAVGSRFSAHVLSALLILPLALGGSPTKLATVASAVAWILVAVSAINVVNFVDGIDGIIGLQAIVFGVHIAVLAPSGSPATMLGLCIAAASIGFLFWNWPPARIFLGDVGSGAIALLGLVAGVLLWRENEWPFVSVFLPLFPIFLDAASTILRRRRRGEKLTQAHRSHLYQRLANDGGWGHNRVSLAYAAASAAATGAAYFGGSRLAASGLYMGMVMIAGYLLDRSVPLPVRAPVGRHL